MAIEVPSNLKWEWPNEDIRALACAPADADVKIGVRVATPEAPRGEIYSYESRGVRFEIGWEGESFAVAVYGQSGLERAARFDADFRHGEIVVTSAFAIGAAYPLEHPLDELVLLHRLTREGCVIVNGSVSLEGREALLFLDTTDNAPALPAGMAFDSRSVSQFVLRPVLEHNGVNDTGVWLHTMPWRNECSDIKFERAPLSAIHILCDDGKTPVERLSERRAENELLQHVFAPVHDPDTAGRQVEAVSRVVRRTSVLRLSKPWMDREISFNWAESQAALGIAPSSL
ncbi:MAG: hypothetical protein OSB60_02880 [Myxococcota bacterium]|jgi:hypothetical protein|nr:hypothetical protein [Myxococcota bacterium]